jgi:LuxR family maltose regulon positive regulatory protein
MARRRIPQVRDDWLTPLDAAGGDLPPLPIGSAAWFAWLAEPANASFAFAGTTGAFTARREQRHGRGYWYAYRNREGCLHKGYLGPAPELTPARLAAAAARLAGPAVAAPAPPTIGQASLLATKLHTPRARPDLVARPSLLARLDAGLATGTLTLLAAPAGSGKTTLLAAWLVRLGYPVAWLSLDDGDQDLGLFLRYLVAALQTVAPGCGRGVLALLQSARTPPPAALLTPLINELAAVPEAWLLVLDDYHAVRAPGIHEAIGFLLDHRPSTLRLAIATREDPPLPLARLRARGLLTELRAADLRFTSGEMAAFLERALGAALAPAQVAALAERTEGWVAGVQLAALAMQDHGDIESFLAAFTGSHRYLLDYVAEEVLARQPDHVHEFLLRTAVLDRLTAPLCDELLAAAPDRGAAPDDAGPPPGLHAAGLDARSTLAQLERANLFLVPLDGERRWYRYHHLFGALLRARLQADRPDLVPILLRRAAAWCAQHALVDEALGYALAAGDEARAAALVEAHAPPALERGDLLSARARLARLPEPLVRDRPRLGLEAATVALLAGDLAAADVHLGGAEQALVAASEPPADLPAELLALRAYQAMALGDQARGPALVERALAALPATSPLRAAALVAAGELAFDRGELAAAVRAFAAVARLAEERDDRPGRLQALAGLTACRYQQGRLRGAVGACREGLALAEAWGLGRTPAAVQLRANLGLALYERDELDEARRQLLAARAINREDGYRTMWSWLAVTLARIEQALGDPGGARATLDAADREARAVDDPWRRAMVASQRIRLLLAAEAGRPGPAPAEAARWERDCGLTPDDAPSFRDELGHLTLARVLLAEPARRAAGLRLLGRLAAAAEAGGRQLRLIAALALRAVGVAATGDRPAALGTLARALALAEPEGAIRPFVDEGAPMAALLRQASPSKASPFVAAILSAMPGVDRPGAAATLGAPAPLAEPLSAREREVLRLLAAGLAGPAIARELSVGHSTVRTHLKRIYGKLAVHSRDQAVARARALRLA